MRAMPWLQSPQRLKAEEARVMRGRRRAPPKGEAEPAVLGGVALLVGGLEVREAPAEERP
jgi:hypothetical protein